MRLFGVIFLLVGSIFMSVGMKLAWSQHRKITTCRPVQAEVVSSRVDISTSTDSDGHRSTTYRPVVEYRYSVSGVSYSSDDVQPLRISAGRGWAEKIVNSCPPGGQVEAFYDPSNPDRAFLIKQYSFFPYIFMLFPMLFVAIGLGVLISAGASSSKPPVPVASSSDWFEAKPASRIVDRRNACMVAAVLWHGIGLPVAGHYFAVAEAPYAVEAWVVTGIYEAIGIAPLVMATYYAMLGGKVTDARVFISQQTISRGKEVAVGLRQKALNPIHVQEVRVGLVCKEISKTTHGSKTTYSTSTCFEEHTTLMEDQNLRSGEKLEASARITAPSGQAASTPHGATHYPRFRWEISVVVRLENSPDYKAGFPIFVI